MAYKIKNLLALAVMGALPQYAVAQSYQTGGIQLAFKLEAGAESQSNAALDPLRPGSTSRLQSGFSFGLLTETRAQRFAVEASARVQAKHGPSAANPQNGFQNPAAAVSYERSSANARLAFAATVQETDLSQSTPLPDLDGGLAILNGSATRRSAVVQISLEWGNDTPVGYGILARIEDTAYRDGSAIGVGGSTVADSRRRNLQATLRLDINAASRLTTKFSYTHFDQDSLPARRETFDINSALKVQRSLGDIEFALGYISTPDGHRLRSQLIRSYALPTGQLIAGLGITRGTTGDSHLMGTFRFSKAFSNGTFDAAFIRTLSSSQDADAEALNTALSVEYNYETSQISSLAVKLDLIKSEDTLTGLSSFNSALGLSYAHDLTRDANVTFGLRHRLRRDDLSGGVRSNEVFVSFARVVTTRY